MAILKIVKAPDPVLKARCKPVVKVNGAIQQLLDDMLETMYEVPGIGLAAPQVGLNIQVAVLDISNEKEENNPVCLINPEIIQTSEGKNTYEEGCLSLPDFYENVIRPKEVTVRFIDRDGKTKEIKADGLLATAIQHEIDHLKGVLFVDHISSLKRNIILRKLKKLKKEGIIK